LLSPVNHGESVHTDEHTPDVTSIGHYIKWNAACLCHRPRKGPLPLRYVGFTLGSDTVKFGPNFSSQPKLGFLADAPEGIPVQVELRPDPDETLWINQLLSKIARRTPSSGWGYDVTIARRDTTLRIFATRSMPMANGDTAIYAAEYTGAAIDSLLGAVLTARDLLPPSLVSQRNNVDVMDLEVTDVTGAVLYRTASTTKWEDDATTSLPESYGGLQIRTQLRPAQAGALLIGGVPASRVPVLLVMLVLTATLCVFAAVQLRREARFATERSNFVANVSHELRTPLTQVRLVLDTLRLGRGGSEQSRDHAFKVADREVLRLQHLVEAVLRFARGPRRNKSPRVVTDAFAEAELVANEFQPLASPRNIVVSVTGDEHASVSLQNGALRQILLNLLDNAVKYGRDDSTVSVDLKNRTNGGVVLSVSDSGPGVPASDRSKIFRAFERGAAARERAVGGSGIGLTIVAEIAAEHGGRAWVETAASGGARFVVELPERAT
ncbi:MAG: HAMP domain-containing sensor histidine kinase, partial [Gemmatimonadaceae bacterium]